jgi:hypothetical protein
MAMKSFLILLTLFGSVLIARAQQQGICGTVIWVSGNHMPGPGDNQHSNGGVIREVLIYKVTRLEDATQKESFFLNIKTDFVKKTVSGAKGDFKITLPPGEYSVFVKEPQGLFANQFDKDNKINVIIVKPKLFSLVNITIDYEATY